MTSTAPDPELERTWTEYRRWAASSRRRKDWLARGRYAAFTLSVSGAAIGVCAQQLQSSPANAKVIGVTSAVLLAIATYISATILSPEKVRQWVRTRATAEALKSEAYRYAGGIADYAGPESAKALRAKTTKLLDAGRDIAPGAVKPDRSAPPRGMTTDQYVAGRLNEQIAWYAKAGARQDAALTRWRGATFVLGLAASAAAALGAWSAKVGPWTAVLTTASAAIVAHIHANRYESIKTAYFATLRKLEGLRAELHSTGGDQPTLLLACEDTLLAENGAWAAEWMSADDKTATVTSRARVGRGNPADTSNTVLD